MLPCAKHVQQFVCKSIKGRTSCTGAVLRLLPQEVSVTGLHLQAMLAFQGFLVACFARQAITYVTLGCLWLHLQVPIMTSSFLLHNTVYLLLFPWEDPADSGADVLLNATVAPTTKLPQSSLCHTSGQGMWGRGVKTGSVHSAPCKDWLRAKSPASSAACATSSASAVMWACTAAAGQTWLGSRPALPAQKLKVWGSPSCSKAQQYALFKICSQSWC